MHLSTYSLIIHLSGTYHALIRQFCPTTTRSTNQGVSGQKVEEYCISKKDFHHIQFDHQQHLQYWSMLKTDQCKSVQGFNIRALLWSGFPSSASWSPNSHNHQPLKKCFNGRFWSRWTQVPCPPGSELSQRFSLTCHHCNSFATILIPPQSPTFKRALCGLPILE